MQNPYVIMTRGFRNVREGDAATGYQIKLRIPYYRGTFLSLIHTLTLSVDSKPVPADRIKIGVQGKMYTLDEMVEADEVRWDFRDPATVVVARQGGLEPGLHEVEVGIVIRKSYFPAEDPEHLYDFLEPGGDGEYKPYIEAPTVIRKKMTLVQ
jgi:hypothetical protein